ncbi:hypothetical protein Har1130_04615 [Haloarcula sp. CBA1130]|nr:hypothetical protein Har1130_04615 [Haloarcula sp. CBA1130]
MTREIYRDIRGRQTTPRSNDEHLSAAMSWLYRSQDVTGVGGSAAYYSLLTGWAGPYLETSGYIIPTLYDYAAYTNADEPRERAEQMAMWLLDGQFDHGAFPGGVGLQTDSDPSVFNTGQILFGLVEAYRQTSDERFLSAVERAGDWLIDVQHPDGYWDNFDYRGERHSYCSRVAWALLEAAELTGNGTFREGAVAHLDWVVSVQTERDWFEYAGFSPDERPYLHTLAYTVRGLLECGLWLDDDTLISAARKTADRLLDCQQRTDVLLGEYDRRWNGSEFYCLTGNAQTALVWLRLYEQYREKRYLTAADTELAFLKQHHNLTGPAAVRGAVRGSVPVWERYMRLRYPNWAVKFLCDALLLRARLQ